MITGKIVALHNKRMRVGDMHWYIREFQDNVFTLEVATTYGRTQQRIALADILEKMDNIHPLGGPSEKTLTLDTLKRDIGKGTSILKIAVKYFSGPTATEAERAAVANVEKIINSIPHATLGEQKATMDAVRDRLAMLADAAMLPHMTTIHQNGLLQTIIGKVNLFYQLYFQRGSENYANEQKDNMLELKAQALVILRDLFKVFEAEYIIATGDLKTLSLTVINSTNSLNQDMNNTVDHREHTRKSHSEDDANSDNSADGAETGTDNDKPADDGNDDSAEEGGGDAGNSNNGGKTDAKVI